MLGCSNVVSICQSACHQPSTHTCPLSPQEAKLFLQDFRIQLSRVVDIQLLQRACDALGSRVSFQEALAQVPVLTLHKLLQWHGYHHHLKLHGVWEMQQNPG
jgi:hypothetical protein